MGDLFTISGAGMELAKFENIRGGIKLRFFPPVFTYNMVARCSRLDVYHQINVIIKVDGPFIGIVVYRLDNNTYVTYSNKDFKNLEHLIELATKAVDASKSSDDFLNSDAYLNIRDCICVMYSNGELTKH